VYLSLCVSVCVCMPVHARVCVYACVCACMCACACACACVQRAKRCRSSTPDEHMIHHMMSFSKMLLRKLTFLNMHIRHAQQSTRVCRSTCTTAKTSVGNRRRLEHSRERSVCCLLVGRWTSRHDGSSRLWFQREAGISSVHLPGEEMFGTLA